MNSKKQPIQLKFNSTEDLKTFLELNIPFAIKPTRPAKTTFINPFTSANAQNVIVEALTEALIKHSKK